MRTSSRFVCLALLLAATPAPAKSTREMFNECESYIYGQMKTSPSTYKRIKAENHESIIPGSALVIITYEAQNIFGAQVRRQQVCRFDKEGNFDSANVFQDETLGALEVIIRDAIKGA